MPGQMHVADPADVIFLYDGSLQGFFCCVFQSVYGHMLPADIQPEASAQPTLFREMRVETEPDKAARVLRSIPLKIGPDALELVQKVFLTCLPQKERAMLRFLLLGYQEGPRVLRSITHPDVAPLLDAEKHMMGEQHLLRGFIRFSDYDGKLAATISPKNFVLPFLAPHFVDRYSCEDFLIFDKTHKAALVYQNRQQSIIPLENINFPQADETELQYRGLWKKFYDTIAIEARYNPKCRMTHMPKRYWEHMTEMQDLL